MKNNQDLEYLFRPKSIAIVGASNNITNAGYALLRNILTSGYKGKIYPVNPNHTKIQSKKSYPSLTQLPNNIDLVIIATPAAVVPQIIDDCIKNKSRSAIIISAGFKETSIDGKNLFKKILQNAKNNQLRILGPNCLGFINNHYNLNASFARTNVPKGSIAFISQSGALGSSILDWAAAREIGFSYFISLGEMLNIGFSDVIKFLEDDEDTKSIILYIESIAQEEGNRFLATASKWSAKKPIIVFKSGTTPEGSQAAQSHTGNLAGDDQIYAAVFAKTGIVRVESISDLYDTTMLLSRYKPVEENGLTIITNAGGPGIIATDKLIKRGGHLDRLSSKTLAQLSQFLPNYWSKKNPVDILGDATAIRYRIVTQTCLADNSVKNILIIITPQEMTELEDTVKILAQINKHSAKNIFVCIMGKKSVATARKIGDQENLPIFSTPESAILALMNLFQSYLYQHNRKIKSNQYQSNQTSFSKSQKIIEHVLNQQMHTLTESQAKQLLQNYGISAPLYQIVNSPNQIDKVIQKLGFPVVLKIVSPDILHKSDVGGILTNIKSFKQAHLAYTQIMHNVKKRAAHAQIEGIMIEKMITKKYELFFGCKKDSNFGPVVAFGWGGINIEVIKDVVLTLPPLDINSAQVLIEQTKIYQIITGFRGQPSIDLMALKKILINFSQLVLDFPQISQIDINPYAVDETGGMCLDAKIILQ